MIFYFTGTGNSLYAAKQLDPELISIPQAIHRERLTFEADSIGIVCPVYGHEMPAMVKEFLRKAEFRTDYFYLVLTYGNIHGGAAELAEQELESDGKSADYINTLKMVDNFLPGFDMKEQIAIDPEKRVDEHIAEIKADIDSRRKWIQPVSEEDREWHRQFLARQAGNPAGPWKIISAGYRQMERMPGLRCLTVWGTGSAWEKGPWQKAGSTMQLISGNRIWNRAAIECLMIDDRRQL